MATIQARALMAGSSHMLVDERPERHAQHRLVAVHEGAAGMQADDGRRLEREDRRSGISTESRAVVKDRVTVDAEDLTWRTALDAEYPLIHGRYEGGIPVRLLGRVTDDRHPC